MIRIYFFEYVLPIAAAVLLAATWIRVIRSRVPDDAPFVRWMPHLIVTLSEVYFWLAALAPHALLGPDCSNLRYGLILANLVAALGIAVILCFWKVVARWWLFAASLLLGLTWLMVAAVQSAV